MVFTDKHRFLFIFLLAIALITGAFVLFFTQQSGKEEEKEEVKAWETYESEQYRFRVQYPSNFPIQESFTGPENRIFVLSINEKEAPEGTEGLPVYLRIHAEPMTTVTSCSEAEGRIDGTILIGRDRYQRCLLLPSDFAEGEGLFIQFSRNPYTYTVRSDLFEQYQQEIEQILSTFEFIAENQESERSSTEARG